MGKIFTFSSANFNILWADSYFSARVMDERLGNGEIYYVSLEREDRILNQQRLIVD